MKYCAWLLLFTLPAWGQAPRKRTTPFKKQMQQRKAPLRKALAKPVEEKPIAVEQQVEVEAEPSSFKFELSGNLEGQARLLKNQASAKNFPLNQAWDNSQYQLAAGNINAKAEFNESRVEGNVFGRYAHSELFGDGYLAPQFLTFPRRLVARDVFRLNHSRVDGDAQADLVVNKLYYELEGEDSRFSFGRMYINYGSGEVFNPINPFNQPLGLLSQTNIAQGNDGFKAGFFTSDESAINFYLLGNKNLDDYENQITPTAWIHGEWRFQENWQLDYVLGQDQRRNKAGGQLNYIWGDAMVFAQALYSSNYVNGKPSENLWDAMLAYDHQLSAKWHLRVEAGYQEVDNELAATAALTASERFLPYEYFVAVAQTYELHPLLKLSATAIRDFKTGFVYGLGRATWSIFNDVEWDFFVNAPLYWDEEEQNIPQKLFPTEAGTALRVFF